MVSTGMAARRPASGVIDDSKKISFGDWKKLAVDGVPPCTRCARAFALGSQPSFKDGHCYTGIVKLRVCVEGQCSCMVELAVMRREEPLTIQTCSS